MKASQRPRRRINWGAVTAVGTVLGALAGVGMVVVAILLKDGGGSEQGPVGASVEDLVRATVQIQAAGENDEPVWWGSGSMIRSDGLVLTAAHIVDNRLDEYKYLDIGVTDHISDAPEMKYRATVSAVDYALDLAVLKIESDLNGDPVVVERPFVAVGDSNKINTLERIRILGYPDVGGETLTATAGSASGFGSQDGIEGRAFVKTDAAMSGGSSGGMAVNDAGELIALPVQFGSGDLDASLVDCRPWVTDTNGDGVTDDADGCMIVGGFINALRPVNLAKPLIDAVERGEPYESPLPETEPEPTFGISGFLAAFENLRFSANLADNSQQVAAGFALPSGVTKACGFWDFDGMTDDTRWDVIWYVDGFRSDEDSKLRRRWSAGQSGTGGPLCIEDVGGLADGYYELNLSVDGFLQLVDGVFIGGEHPFVTFTLENQSKSRICSVFFSPTDMTDWGQDDLPAGAVIEPSESHSFQLPAGVYDIAADDCEDQELDAVYGHTIADGGGTLTIPTQAP